MLKLYNTLTKKIEEFKPLKSDFVRIYDCGPTVYFYAHIGNMWRYVISDLLRRTLEYDGYQVKQVMNITDVGHLTEDDLAADTGEDKMVVAAKKEKKTPEQIAEFYTQAFLKDRQRLNILRPHVIPKATEHIQEMIKLIKILEKKGYAYWAGDKYFVYDIAKFKNYGKLSGKKIEELKAGARLEPIKEKHHPFDFALWIKDSEHLMRWDSAWGIGYPGWHIECSAMAMKYLGPTLDIHTGGEDNIFPHHENEIAQSEAATNKQFVRFWLHVRHNLVDGKKMSKSGGNFYILQDLIDKGFDPLAYRYLCLTTHYRKNLNFTWESLERAQKALEKLRNYIRAESLLRGGAPAGDDSSDGGMEQELGGEIASYSQKFSEAINDDLNLPKALSIVWELIKSNYPDSVKKASILKFDQVLGLGLLEATRQKLEVSREVKELLEKREKFRKEKKWQEADEIRKKIAKIGYQLEDNKKGSKLRKTRHFD
ncbi:cysteine--tRNA ligase [Candidatus Microgenomates bacterium]|nr:cysteine--tRNA ligase [Candidatus Microgenomates bacterium]